MIDRIRKELLEDGPNYHIGAEKCLWLLNGLEAALARIKDLEKELAKEKKDKK